MQPASSPSPFPIIDPTTSAGKQAAKLHAAWCEQYRRTQSVEADYQAAQGKARETDGDLRDVLAKRELGKATDREVSAAEDAYAEAKDAAEEPWHQRATAAVHASEERRHDYAAFVDDHLEELLEDGLVDEAEAARAAILEAAEALAAGFDRWSCSRKASAALVSQAQGINGQALPILNGPPAQLAKALDGLLENADSLPTPAPDRRHLMERRYMLGIETPPG